MDRKLCVVGDLHGRIKTFQRIVEDHSDYDFILLGDVIHHKHYFRRNPRTNPIRMIEYIISLGDRVQTICGNNEHYILERLNYPLKDIYKREAKFTISCLRDLNSEKRMKILKWMINLPSKMEIENFRFAHAFYDDPNPRLYGPGERWFEYEKIDKYNLDNNYIYFIGHYGRPFFYRNIRCIDCTELEGIGIWLLDKNLFQVYT